MGGHAYVNQIADPAAKKALLDALGTITLLTQRIAALEAAALVNTAVINANNQNISNLQDAKADNDAVTLRQLRAVLAAQVETF